MVSKRPELDDSTFLFVSLFRLAYFCAPHTCLQKNNNEQFPLHFVIESRCLENLKQVEHILHDVNIDSEEPHRRYSPYVNVMMDHGQNSLHLLAEALTNENCDTIFEMIKILINHGCNANYPNYDGKTAFFIVLEKLRS